MAMDYAACNVIYVDKTSPVDKLVLREEYYDENLVPLPKRNTEPTTLEGNLRTLLGTFAEGA